MPPGSATRAASSTSSPRWRESRATSQSRGRTRTTNTNAYSVSAEIGHRFSVTPFVFVEPQLELSYGHVSGKSFDTVNRLTQKAISNRLDGYDSLVGRAGVVTQCILSEKETLIPILFD